MGKNKPYQQRNDLEKIQSQWKKLTGLHTREEWSSAIIRAATAAEIAANYVIRKEFESRSEFDPKFVDSLLRWANGLSGKIDRLLLPLYKDRKQRKAIEKLKKVAAEINSERNAIVHQGRFCNEKKAVSIIKKGKHFIETLVRLYDPEYELRLKKG